MSARGSKGTLLAGALALAAAVALAPALPPLARSAQADEDPQIYLDAEETFAIADPPVTLTRPDKDWTFIDLAKQRAAFLKTRPIAEVDQEFVTLKARVFHYSTKALLSVHALAAQGAAPTAAQLVETLRADIGRRPGAELVQCGAVQIPGAEVAALADWVAKVVAPRPVGAREAPGAQASDVWFYRRIDIPRPNSKSLLLLMFEVPKERKAKAEPGLSKILKKLKLG